MPVAIACPCGAIIRGPDKLAGRTVFCPQCSTQLTIPILTTANGTAAARNQAAQNKIGSKSRIPAARGTAVADAPSSPSFRATPGPDSTPLPKTPALKKPVASDVPVAEVDDEPAKPVAVPARKAKRGQRPKASLKRIPPVVWACVAATLFVVAAFSTNLLLPKPAEFTVQEQNRASGEMTISAEALLMKYATNEAEADRTYPGIILNVMGKIAVISRDHNKENKMYVDLKGSKDNKFAAVTVQCFFQYSHEVDVSGLQAGDVITVRGRCDGKDHNIILKECRVIARPSRPRQRNGPGIEG